MKLYVACAVCSVRRVHGAGYVGFHTRVRVKNPSIPNPTTQPGLCPSAGSATSTACVSGPGLTHAAEHVGVSSVARHGPSVRCRADPGRSQMKLQLRPGFCPATVAVSVAFHPTHTCVGRMETETATFEGQKPGSGGSCNWDRAGFTRQRADGPCRATHETPTCSAARVRPGPETHLVDVADPPDGQRPGWVAEFGMDGFFTRTRV